MTSHDWFVDQRAAFATRTLDPGDERLFADHLARCPECRAAVAAVEGELGWLPMVVDPVVPSPEFLARALARATGRSRWTRWETWVPLALAAGIVLAAGLAVRNASNRADRLDRALTRSRDALAALSDSVAILKRAAKILQASIEMDHHRGGLVIFADSASHRWNVVFHGLPPAPAGEKYQLWFITSDGMLRSVELTPNGQGPVFVALAMPGGVAKVLGASLSMEPSDNGTNQPRGKELAHLML